MKISICMATYNGSNYVLQQINSILSQMSQDDELLVADDGSSDQTLSILRTFEGRIKIVDYSLAGGVVPNFERVIKSAQGDVVVLADQDDVWLPGRLEKIRVEIQTADVVLLNANVVDQNLNSLGFTLFESVGVGKGLLKNFLKNSYVGCCLAFRKEVLSIALPFPKNLPWHDWYLGLISEAFFNVKHVDTPYLLFRRHPNNHSDTCKRSKNSFKKKLLLRFWVLYAFLIATTRKIRLCLIQRKENG